MFRVVKASVTIFAKVTAILASVAILLYLFLLGRSHVYISGGLAEGFFMNNSLEFPLWDFYKYDILVSFGLPSLNDYGPISVDTVHAAHGVRNVIFLMCSAGLATLMPLLFFVVGIMLALQGLFTANWENFFGGILAFVLGILVAIVALLFLILSYIGLLFQPSTPAYTLIWIVLGLPFFVVGAAGGASPTVVVLVFINK